MAYYSTIGLQPVFYNGDPVIGAKIYVYDAGTNTPRTAYTDEYATVPHPIPFLTDANGSIPPFWVLSPVSIKLVIKNPDDTVIRTIDGIPTAAIQTTTVDLKNYTPKTIFPSSGLIFGADNQSAYEPSVYTFESLGTSLSNYLSSSTSVYPTIAAGISNGVINVTGLVAGSGGTNGTFPLAFSGGGGSNAAGYFVVSGGAVTQVIITSKGYNYTSAPTLSFSASSGLTSASATAVIGEVVSIGEYFLVPSNNSNEYMILYRKDSGPVATEIKKYSTTLDFVNQLETTIGQTHSTYKIVENTGTVLPSVYKSISYTSGTQYEFLVIAKAAERSRINLIDTGGLLIDCTFDLLSGTCTAGVVGGVQAGQPSIISLGNGWYLCRVLKTSTLTTTSNIQVRVYPASGSASYTGDGVSGLYVESAVLQVVGTTTNLLGSSKLNDASYTKSGILSVNATTLNQKTGGGLIEELNTRVFGTLTGHGFTEGSGSISPSCYRSISWVSGSTYKIEIDAKADTRKVINLFSNAGAIFSCTFDLEKGTSTASGASSPTASISYLSNGWYRCIVNVTATATSSSNFQIRIFSDSLTHPYTGDGVSGLFINTARVIVGGIDLLENTNNFSVSYWTKASITINANATTFAGIVDKLGEPSTSYYSGKNYVALGTSITAGGYPTNLNNLLGASLTNLGVSGASIGQASNGHYGSLVITNAIASVPTNADVVTIEAGINDFGAAAVPLGQLGDTTTATFYGALYNATVAIKARSSSAKIIFLTPYSGGILPSGGTSTHRHFVTNSNGNYLYQFQKAVKEVADFTGWPCIDVGQSSGIGYQTSDIYTSDGLHINATGRTRYANYVYKEMIRLAENGFLGI